MAGAWTTIATSASFSRVDNVQVLSTSGSNSFSQPSGENGQTYNDQFISSVIGFYGQSSSIGIGNGGFDTVTNFTSESTDITYSGNTASYSSQKSTSYSLTESLGTNTSSSGTTIATASASWYSATLTNSTNSNQTDTIISSSQTGMISDNSGATTFSTDFGLLAFDIYTTASKTSQSEYFTTKSLTESIFYTLTNSSQSTQTISFSSTYYNLDLDTETYETRTYGYTYIHPHSAILYNPRNGGATITGSVLKTGYGSFDGQLNTQDLVAGFTATKSSISSVGENIIKYSDFLLLEGQATTFTFSNLNINFASGAFATGSGDTTLTANTFSSSQESFTATVTTQDSNCALPFWTTTTVLTYSKYTSYSYTQTYSTQKTFDQRTFDAGAGSDSVGMSFSRSFLDTSLNTSSFITYFIYPTTWDQYTWTRPVRVLFTNTYGANATIYSESVVNIDTDTNNPGGTTSYRTGNLPDADVATYMHVEKPITNQEITNYYIQTGLFGNFATDISGLTAYWEINSDAKAALTTFSAKRNRFFHTEPFYSPTYFRFGNTTSSFYQDPLITSISGATIHQSISSVSSSTSIYQTVFWSSFESSLTRSFPISVANSTGTILYTTDSINDSDSDPPYQYSAGEITPIAYIEAGNILNTNGQGFGASFNADGFYFKTPTSFYFISGTSNSPVSAEKFNNTAIGTGDPAYQKASIISMFSGSEKIFTSNKQLINFFNQ